MKYIITSLFVLFLINYANGQYTPKKLVLNTSTNKSYKVHINEQNLDSLTDKQGTQYKINKTTFNKRLFPYSKCELFIYSSDSSGFETKIKCKEYLYNRGFVFEKSIGHSSNYWGNGTSYESGDYGIIYDIFISPILQFDSTLQIFKIDAPSFDFGLSGDSDTKFFGSYQDSLGRDHPSNYLRIDRIDTVNKDVVILLKGNLYQGKVLDNKDLLFRNEKLDSNSSDVSIFSEVKISYSYTANELISMDSKIDIISKGKLNLLRRVNIKIYLNE